MDKYKDRYLEDKYKDRYLEYKDRYLEKYRNRYLELDLWLWCTGTHMDALGNQQPPTRATGAPTAGFGVILGAHNL